MLWASVALGATLCAPRTRAVVIQWVTVGDPRNAYDNVPNRYAGEVDYTYQISKFDTTVAQYTEFLNAKDSTGANTLGLYDVGMTLSNTVGGINFNAAAPVGSKYSVKPGRGNNPAVLLTYYSALRFANWLNNGQGNADTESGAYTLLGGTPQPSNFQTITRSPTARIVLTNDDEWYKAAYYKGGGNNAGYWTYATQSDTLPLSAPPSPAAANSANYYSDAGTYAVTGSGNLDFNQDYLTDVGAYGGSPSPYGTFDQNGDVYQWLENVTGGAVGLIRGGAWDDTSDTLRSSFYSESGTFGSAQDIGFRLAAIPEPSAIAAAAAVGTSALMRRRWSKPSPPPAATFPEQTRQF
jgi:formylglycine-generating enzyme required for sulfatase activity